MLSVNGTVVIQIANFLVLLLILNLILYRPIRKILAQRNAEFSLRESQIKQYHDRGLKSQQEIDAGMIAAQKDGFAEKEALKAEGLAREKKLLQEAGASVEQKLGTARGEIDRNVTKVRESLEAQLQDFSNDLAEKILGRSVR